MTEMTEVCCNTCIYPFKIHLPLLKAIRVSCEWYKAHLPKSVDVVLLSDDAENRKKAIALGLSCASGMSQLVFVFKKFVLILSRY